MKKMFEENSEVMESRKVGEYLGEDMKGRGMESMDDLFNKIVSPSAKYGNLISNIKSPPGPQHTGTNSNNNIKESKRSCNCKNSRCLKLYCECFASGEYCTNCNCLCCMNNRDNEAARKEAVQAILERNPNAFRPKISNPTQHKGFVHESTQGKHSKVHINIYYPASHIP